VKLLRQLRLKWEDFAFAPQMGSRIAFPGVHLDFNNEFELLETEVADRFPSERDRFRRLVNHLADYDDLDRPVAVESARGIVASLLSDPLLIVMLLCPLMFYGNARPRDMDFGQFCVLFRSIFCEGLARPLAGVRVILRTLVRRFKQLGGEIRLRTGVARLAVDRGRVASVELDDGTQLTAKRVLSSAGWLETMRMCGDGPNRDDRQAGQLSFAETISILDRDPKELGLDRTVVFFNDSDKFHWEKPDGLVDTRSGVICSPNNFAYDSPLPENVVRITALANYDRWNGLDEAEYRDAKREWYERMAASAARFVPEFRKSVVETDMFTPKTIRRYTGHINGAVYGCPEKHPDGTTHLSNLFVCGTDQGLVGIIGSMISGIAMANRHLLKIGTDAVRGRPAPAAHRPAEEDSCEASAAASEAAN
jgi:phytoene dehydrogenase-like protein